MKNYVLTIMAVLAALGFTFAQTTYVDFETNPSPTVYVFGGNGFGADKANPNTTGNTSATVGEVVTGAETWSGIAMPLGGTVGFSATATTFSMDVLSNTAGDVVFKLENGTAGVEVTVNYDTPNAWKTLEFVFPDTLQTDFYKQIVLFFNFGTTDATTWYFDNIVGPEATFSGAVDVNLNINDKLSVASTVALSLDGANVPLTLNGTIWSATKNLAPYTIVNGGGQYQVIVAIDGTNVDTAMVTVTGGGTAMDWNYLHLVETPEDGTAKAISTSTAPTMDGVADAVWNNAKIHPLQQRAWWGTATGLYSYYKILWDIDNFYLLVVVDDATPTNDGALPYENDNIEVLFDMNESKATPYDADDYQIRTVRGLDTWTGSANVTAGWAGNLMRGQKTTANGYVVEMAFPWTSLSTSFLPLADFASFGFDVLVADVADGAGRDYIIGWTCNQDVAYQNTEPFGKVSLSSLTTETGSTAIDNMANAKVSVCPSLVIDQLTVTAELNIKSVKVINLAGIIVAAANNVNTPTTELDLSALTTGVYLVNVVDATGAVATKKITVK